MSAQNTLQVILPARNRSVSDPNKLNLVPEPESSSSSNGLSELYRLKRYARSDMSISSILEKGRRPRIQSVNSDLLQLSDTETSDASNHIISLLGRCTPSSTKSNRAFHSLFCSVPSKDHLIDVYKCAIQKEILHQGHIYVSEHHVCFRSNIFGWETTLVMAFTEITDIQKRKTAKIIPNGLTISTSNANHVFASLLFRDQAYELMMKLWNLHKSPEIIISQPTKNECNDFDDSTTLGSASIINGESNTQASIEQDDTCNSETNEIQPNLLHEGQELLGDSQSFSPKSLLSRSLESTVTLVSSYYPTTCKCISEEKPHHLVVVDQSFPSSVETAYKLLFESDFLINYFEQKRSKAKSSEMPEDQRNSTKKSTERGYNTTHKTLHLDKSKHIAVESTTIHHRAPGGCTFELKTRTCIRKTDPLRVNLRITINIEFISNGFHSSILQKSVIDIMKGVFSSISDLIGKRDSIHLYTMDKDILSRLSTESEMRERAEIYRVSHPIYSGIQSVVSLIKPKSSSLEIGSYHMVALGVTLLVFWNLWMVYHTNKLLNHKLQESMKSTVHRSEDPFEVIFDSIKSIENVLDIVQKDALQKRQQLIEFIET
ncbi:GRAM domain-containing protein [Phycomyces blakesleeanus]